MTSFARSLDELLADFELARFLTNVWEQAPWSGAVRERRWVSMLWDDGAPIEHLLTGTRARLSSEDVRVVRYGAPFPDDLFDSTRLTEPLDARDVPRLTAALERTYTLVAALDRSRPGATAALCALFEQAFACTVHAAVYITPAGAQGFPAHHDKDDVFVFQIFGEKLWNVAAPRERWPLDNALFDGAALESATRLLKEGSVLYLPRGFVHWATTAAGPSVHVTISTEREHVHRTLARRWIEALGAASAAPLPLAIWDHPDREEAIASWVASLLDDAEPAVRSAPPIKAPRPPPERGWLARALKGAST